MTYSTDLRTRTLSFIKEGGTKAEAARRFDVARSTIFTWLKQSEQHKAGKPGPKSSWKFDQDALVQEVLLYPDKQLTELASSRGVSTNTIARVLKRMGITRKKARYCRQSKNNEVLLEHYQKKLKKALLVHTMPVFPEEALSVLDHTAFHHPKSTPKTGVEDACE